MNMVLPCASGYKQFLTHVHEMSKLQAINETLLHCMTTLELSYSYSNSFYHTGWLDSTGNSQLQWPPQGSRGPAGSWG